MSPDSPAMQQTQLEATCTSDLPFDLSLCNPHIADIEPAHLQRQTLDEEEVSRCLQGSGCNWAGAQEDEQPKFEAVSAAAAACLTACTRDMAAQLADLLHSKLPGSRVVYCTSGQADQPSKCTNSPGSNSVKQRWSLGHAFILVYTGSWPSAVPLIVEPNFRSRFELPRASKHYTAFLSSLPELLVVDAEQMQPLVAAVSKCVANEFKHMDLPLPPWRTAPALQSRWQTDMVTKEHIIPADPHSRTASHSSSSSSSDGDASSTVELPSSSTTSVSSPCAAVCNTPKLVVQGFQPSGASSGNSARTASAPSAPAAHASPMPAATSTAAPAAQTSPMPTATPAAASAAEPTAPSASTPVPPPAPKKTKDDDLLQRIFTIRRRTSAAGKRQSSVQHALDLSEAATAISTRIPAWRQSVSQSRSRELSAGSNSKVECLCLECGYGVGPPIYKTKMIGWGSGASAGRAQAQSGLQLVH